MRLHALPAILKFLGTLTLNICGGVRFQYNYKWVDWTARIAYKELYQRQFSKEVFPNIPKQQFFQTSPENCMK